MENYEIQKINIDNFYKKVGNNVKRIREKKGFSQLQLANEIGHNSVGHIAKAEIYAYNKRFNLEQLYKISIVLQVDIKDFFD
ncbi:transcriptional regulator, XRE family [Campylobacter blaseri]|uniref:Transcriptional regulator n=1 Tax=Campylobacter blaseri TaxID=2042961 RepID=A0A2P8R098_9BACT|nr:helix-turn-helix transcriptional regulator [Campylobacter blaseri]PSM51924.1 transcriptional regulator [Campylobacter blaseri]PSM53708.1 transcriptional regulator [Campylobacter blaseri]QKF85738.1 transcriptional regulator, XRE family [Campylobacter blaseri]